MNPTPEQIAKLPKWAQTFIQDVRRDAVLKSAANCRRPVHLQRLIRALRGLEKDWPKDYWLFAASGTLTLMRKKNGVRAVCGKETGYADGGMDPKQIVTTFGGIECDGGDW